MTLMLAFSEVYLMLFFKILSGVKASERTLKALSHPGRESFLAERLLGRGDRQSSLRETRDPLKEEYHSKPEPNSPDRSLPGIKSTVKA